MPETTDYKQARKIVAEISANLDITEGKYLLGDAKGKLNQLKRELVQIINNEVTEFDYLKSIPILISSIDAISAENYRDKLHSQGALQHEVDYSPEEKYAEKNEEHIRLHRNYRYLIEKFVQLTPGGDENFTSDDLKRLLAMIDWLYVIQNASDALHYGISPVALTITHDLVFDIEIDKDYEDRSSEYAITMSKLTLNTMGIQSDRVQSSYADFWCMS